MDGNAFWVSRRGRFWWWLVAGWLSAFLGASAWFWFVVEWLMERCLAGCIGYSEY